MDFDTEKSTWNPLRYLLVFLVGFIGDIIIHIIAHNRYAFTSLMYYYTNLATLPPLSFNPTFKTYLYGGLFGGLACLIALFVSDIIFESIEYRKLKTEFVKA